jgi:integration host factor subunit alpha
MTLTKANIAQRIADDCGFMRGEAAEVSEKHLDIMKKKLIVGEDIMISGFGKWHIRSKRHRRGNIG